MIRKKIIIVLLFLIVLTGLRFIWLEFFKMEQPYSIEKGQIHLNEMEIENQDITMLEGEWEFYPNQLLNLQEIAEQEKTYMQFPEQWFTYVQDQAFTYGTFHLQTTLNNSLVGQSLAIYMPRFPSASNIYVNGEQVGESGNLSTTLENYRATTLPYYVIFQTESPVLDIVVQASHDGSTVNFGSQPILFGQTDDIIHLYRVNMLTKIIVLVFILLLTVAVIFLFFMRYQTKQALYFGLLMISIAIMILLDRDGAPLLVLPIESWMRYKLTFLIHISIAINLLKFTEYFLSGYIPKTVYRVLTPILIGYGLFIVFLPNTVISVFQGLLGVMYLISLSLVIIQIVRANIKGEAYTFLLMLAAVAVLNNIVWAIMKHRMDLIIDFYPLDILIALFLFEGFWICLFIQHVKDIEKKNIKLHLANKSRDDFLANTSHEMRNPLHSMIHIAQYVLDNPENNITNKDRNDLVLLVRVGRRMSMLINDLIDLSQIKEHNLRLDQKPVGLHGQIQVVLDMLAHVVEGKPLQIMNKVDRHFPLLIADENRLNQILLNLVHNAVKFTEKGTIVIQAKERKDMAVIEVIDSGKGIAKADIESIFLPYEQIIGEEKAYRTGTGLGLAITKELIELQGGTISVESELGKGTTFRFTLALFDGNTSTNENIDIAATVMENVEQPEPVQQTSHQQFRILLVDDERINLTVVSKILDRDLYEIIFADSGIEALNYLNEQQFDLVISDVMMPMMSGFELTKKIREHYNLSELPVLLLTARARPEDIETGFLSGANDYIIKPIEPLELRARVRVLTELKEATIDQLRMEAAWLRAQINPHFLSNTLSAILGLLEQDQEKMRHLLDQFLHFLHTSFNIQSTDDFILLEQELNLVDAYLTIEQARFGERIRIHKHIEVDSSAIYIPPFMLQTLVENAVRHGILKQPEGGKITIEAVYQENKCKISIKDNGVGMPEEIKEMVRANIRVDDFGIGLWNTEKRLQQYVGEGLSITSEPGQGTTISFKLPC